MSSVPDITVYSVAQDCDRFQYVQFDGSDDDFDSWEQRVDATFLGTPRRDTWDPPPVYSPRPRLERPDAWGVSWTSTAFALNQRAVDALSPLMWSVELLPLPLGDELLQLVNIVDVIECLDRERSIFEKDGSIVLFSFIAHRVPASPLFKIPDELGIFTPEFAADPPSFRRLTELHDLRGFVFSEAWNNDEGARPLPCAF